MTKASEMLKIKEALQGRTDLKPKLFYLAGEFYLIQGHTLTGLKASEIPGFLTNNDPELTALNINPVWDKETREFDDSDFRASLPAVIRSTKILPCVSRERAMMYLEFLRAGKVTEYFEILTPGSDKRGVQYPGVTLFQMQ